MAKYVDIDVAKEAVRRAECDANWDGHRFDAEFIENALDFVSVADVVPVVHGRWIRPHWKNSNYCCDCSECGGEAMHKDYQWDKNGIYPICPNCGAKMDGETESK